ncbi:hypothetical protein AURDEDRAFT_184419 [Auricularia subglabra TFB-10046 SS5]|nr:hypothetical protein AURDEDRAFT_184419 [Auricularia subglabra TFB-10046 SS5]
MLRRLLRTASRRYARYRAALDAEAIKADYPACFDRRLLRRVASFTLISCALLFLSARRTNQLSYRWWKAVIARNGPGEVTTYDYTPVVLRAEYRRESVRRINTTLYTYLPPGLASLATPAFRAAEVYVDWVDAARFIAVVTLIQFAIYLATWTRRGDFLVHRYLAHSGLSGRTYTVFTAALTHTHLSHILINTVGLALTLPFLAEMMQHGSRVNLWDFTVPRLLAFYIISGGFGYFVPTVLAHIFARKHIIALPRDTTAMGPLPLEIPTGFRVCVGASPALWAMMAVHFISLEGEFSVASIPIRKGAAELLLFVLMDLPLVLLVPIGTLQHFFGTVFGVLIFYTFGQHPVFWDVILTIVGNRHTAFERQAVDLVLPNGTTEPSYNVVISHTPLGFGR